MATLDDEQAAINRRQKIAEMLTQQGQQPLETNQVAGGYVVPVSPMAGVAKVAQQLAGAYLGKKADERQTALADKKLADVASIDLSAPDLSSQLMKRGMVTEALAAQKDSMKVHREGIPAGFNATDGGGIAPMPMANGGDYGQFLLQQAGAKAQIPSYGEPQKLALAQESAARDAERLQIARDEKNNPNWQTIPDNNGALKQINPKTGEVRDLGVQGKSQASGRPLPAGSANTLAEGSQLVSGVLGGLHSMIEDNKSMFGPVAGVIHSINPYDKKGQEIDAELRRSRQSIGSYLEGGVLRKEDEIKYEKMLPKLNDLPEVAKEKLKGIDALLRNKQNEYLKSYENAGFNVVDYTDSKNKFSDGRINVDIKGQLSPEDQKLLDADIAKERAKQADTGADDPAYQEYLRGHKK